MLSVLLLTFLLNATPAGACGGGVSGQVQHIAMAHMQLGYVYHMQLGYVYQRPYGMRDTGPARHGPAAQLRCHAW
jgi:hypothetical protein